MGTIRHGRRGVGGLRFRWSSGCTSMYRCARYLKRASSTDGFASLLTFEPDTAPSRG